MSWSEADPGQGSPAGIQGVAALRTARAAKVRDAQRTIQSVASQSGVDWEAASQQSFAAELSKKAADIELVATGLEKQATALTTYAGALTQIKDRQVVLETRRATAEQDLASAQLKLSPLIVIPQSRPTTLFPEQAAPDPQAEAEAARHKAKVQALIDEAQRELRAVDAEWDVLVSDRRRIDGTCAAALQSQDVLGQVVTFTAAAIAASSPADLLDRLKQLNQADLEILLGEHPELAERMNQATPEQVASWWNGMGNEQQEAFVNGIPSVIGALNGVSALDRVAANRINAAERLAYRERQLKEMKEAFKEYGSSIRAGDIADLEAEVSYLKKATSEPPDVQLYLYEPDDDRIIEMIGTPSDKTNKVVTYTPGTAATLDGFYDGSTRDIGSWLQQRDREGLVAFVYKDGRYPQNPLTEANDQDYAVGTGQKLAAFEDGVFRDPLLSGAKSIAIGHSWGTANVTSSEVAGAHYDLVVSISGAGVPVDWTKDPTTMYADYSYDDILQDAQRTLGGDKVWDGRNPRKVGFEHGDYYTPPTTWKNAGGPWLDSAPKHLLAGVDSHLLAATTEKSNLRLLTDLEKRIDGGEY
ncbi:hypothetical protein DEI99_006275 [Curtobacterium sp. MCLR17_036]|uniref:hypothetical protein n=1 Tax=Curtobacterium sp. MCLR17_036 TaxID=2175620 RepID=UPI000DAA4A91|nr:hypothetical protein [Curtobacterium sp. MCLR17_036]WIE66137.1 hypothetical protein DEI99_006275 [Curtobacterium sp. MCLR17_036]